MGEALEYLADPDKRWKWLVVFTGDNMTPPANHPFETLEEALPTYESLAVGWTGVYLCRIEKPSVAVENEHLRVLLRRAMPHLGIHTPVGVLTDLYAEIEAALAEEVQHG